MISERGLFASAEADAGARKLFSGTFGGTPAIVASAPGRVNLIGEHTDYNGGQVLPIAIAQRTWVAARSNGGSTMRVVSATQSEAGEFPVDGGVASGKWWDYPAGVAAQLALGGGSRVGVDMAVWSDVPAGAGLASSAALQIACGLALARAASIALAPRDLAMAAHRAEQEFAGVATGVMDQFACALSEEGHALHIWCDTGDIAQVPFSASVLVFDTGVTRELRRAAYNERRAECDRALELLRREDPELRSLAAATAERIESANLPAPLDRRARHVTSETRRVERVAAALARGEPLPGDDLLASHESLRRDYECSCAELDWFVERVMREPGVAGARLTGAGWGGCAIAAGDRTALEHAARAVSADYGSRFGRTARWWVTGPSAGAFADDVTAA